MQETRDLVPDEVIESYERDGVVVIRGLISPDWVDRMRQATDRVIGSLIDQGRASPDPDSGARFAHDLFLWRYDADFRAVALNSPLPAVAARLMRTQRLNLFFDQLLVKEPGSKKPIRWHQDLVTFPMRGEQIISLWVPFDTTTPESGGVYYAKGSHRWNQLIHDYNYSPAPGDVDMPDPSTFELLEWTLEPGDVIAHHPLTVHGSEGNSSATLRRRAVSIRYAGDDARFSPKELNFMSAANIALPDLPDGSPLDHELFPLLPSAAEYGIAGIVR
jgi:ectoine hydroxylase-related dioxygenase (phytanoyl-CoA dioxygenase family)